MDILDKMVAVGYEIVEKNKERFEKKRYLYEILDKRKESESITAVLGLRGAGKTVLLSQLMDDDYVYLSLDYPQLRVMDMFRLLKKIMAEYKPRHVILDEFHRSMDIHGLRMFYEAYKGEVKLWVSGSSALRLSLLELERRVEVFQLKPFSLREYLYFKYDKKIEKIEMEDILSGKANRLAIYDEYIGELMERGLPYLLTSGNKSVLIDTFLDVDLPALMRMNEESKNTMLKLMFFLANASERINISSMAKKLGISKSLVFRYLDLLAKAGFVINVLPCKPNRVKRRVFFYTPLRITLLSMFGLQANLGVLAEEFFVNHVEGLCFEDWEGSADFVVNGKTFEIGGAGKKWKQRADYRIVYGRYPRVGEIPLAAFGFLY